ncbi:hypothetical protein [Hyphobacterium sp.]|uniref:hypothetical protein n=1 Tax=Hyphobacterium sp. TaxID=2004662 RepID=UPI003BA95B07
MKHALSMLAVALLTGAASAQVTGEGTERCGDYGAPHPDAPPEFAQFAFIIGDFDVGYRTWDAEAGGWLEPQFQARWNGYYGLNGRAVIDEWFDPGYGYRAESGTGINIRLYDEGEGRWETAWHYTANYEVRELHQELREDGRLWLWQVYPEAPQRRVWFETFDDGEWARFEQRRNDAGEWANAVMLHAIPADCGEGG